MDGAAKFVRGDAIAGLLITFINCRRHDHRRRPHGAQLRPAAESYTIG
jgi:flagellar biosynthesis component FlhA